MVPERSLGNEQWEFALGEFIPFSSSYLYMQMNKLSPECLKVLFFHYLHFVLVSVYGCAFSCICFRDAIGPGHLYPAETLPHYKKCPGAI